MTCGACAKARRVLPSSIRKRLEKLEQERIARKKAKQRGNVISSVSMTFVPPTDASKDV
jgi:hypothetical protein